MKVGTEKLRHRGGSGRAMLLVWCCAGGGLGVQDVLGRTLSRGAEGPGVNWIRHIVLWAE